MFEPTYDDDGIPTYVSCHVCGRVLTDDDHTDEAGTDGTIYWDQYIHSPAGLAELEAVLAFEEAEAARIAAESRTQLQKMIDDAVRDALAERGI